MKKVNIRFRKAKIIGFNRFDNTYELVLDYTANDASCKFSRKYGIKKVEDMMEEVIKLIKEKTKEDFGRGSDDDDILARHVVIDFEDIEGFEKKFVMFVKRFQDSISEFRKNKYADGYINKMFSLDEYEKNF